MTPTGLVADLATAADRALPAGIFSTAARRVLRPGPARTAHLSRTFTPGEVLGGANRCPAAPTPTADGVPLQRLRARDLTRLLQRVLERGEVDDGALLRVVDELDIDQVAPALRDVFDHVRERLRRAAEAQRDAPWVRAVELLLAAVDTSTPTTLSRSAPR